MKKVTNLFFILFHPLHNLPFPDFNFIWGIEEIIITDLSMNE
jgi:hypothetical protein